MLFALDRLFALKFDEAATQWTKPVTIQVRAMVLTDKVLFVAGPPAGGRRWATTS